MQLGSPEFPATWRRGRIGRAALLHCGELRVAVRFTLTWLFSFIFIPGLTSGSFSFSFSNVFAPSSTWDVRDAYEVALFSSLSFLQSRELEFLLSYKLGVWNVCTAAGHASLTPIMYLLSAEFGIKGKCLRFLNDLFHIICFEFHLFMIW